MKAALQNGFTLVEMAMVLLIVGLLLGGLMVPLSAQMEQHKISETRKTLDEIQQALLGYAIANGRLPCPADATTPTGQVNAAGVSAGTEYKTTGSPYTCATNIPANNAAWGVLPWATLGVSETDAWGRRFTYHVTTIFADDISANTFSCTPTTPPTQSSFALCSNGNLNVGLSAGNSNVAANVPAVIVSHGTDGLGAFTPAGQQIQPVPGPLTDQGDNVDNDNNFVNHDFTPIFDDLVVWISPNVLFNRMVAAGKLP